MADAVAKTSTPDAAAGNPIDITTVTTGAGVVDRQVVALGDPAANNKAAISAAGRVSVDASGVAVPVTGTFFQATQPVSGTVTTNPPANASENVAQFGGTNVVTGVGASAAGVPRVTVSNDSSLAANQSVNINQYGGTGVTLGQKAMTASEPVVLASDQAAIPISTIAGAITPGTTATALGKAEDAASASGDTGVAVLGIRTDVPNLPTVATTNANSDYAQVSVDDHGVVWVRKRQLVGYSAVYRLGDATAGRLGLSVTPAANTTKQIATIYHTGTSTKTVKLRRAAVIVIQAPSTATVLSFELRALSSATAPATGNPAITPTKLNLADASAEAVCLAVPTTQGSYTGVDLVIGTPMEWNAAIGAATANPSGLAGQEIVLYEYKDGMEMEPPTMRAANAEGFAIVGRTVGMVAYFCMASILFTEE